MNIIVCYSMQRTKEGDHFLIRRITIMTTCKKITKGLLALVLMITVLFGMNINAEATYRAV